MGQALAQFDYATDDVAFISPLSPLAVAVFADRGYVRAEMAEDAAAAGLRVTRTAELGALMAEGEQPLGDLVLVDCPVLEGADMAALARLDMRVARSGAKLVVSTSIGSLDDVFACLDQSDAQILVSPSRADRVIALGRLLLADDSRVRELSDHDRMSLLRLTEQVSQIAQKLETLSDAGNREVVGASAFSFDATGARDPSSRLVRNTRPALPDPLLVRKIIRQRQLRARFFDGDLFADPAWDMLLDLAASRAEHKRVSVTSLCIASGVPPTTALRWITQMTEAGLFCRAEDESDRRRAFITLSEKAIDAVAHYFAEIGTIAAPV
ncbi:DNA-binding NarL/FixJ family response regulator [Novosphingobium hassiacum]|uniref:DNA-binding NarL/FixJ family response regulator n=1 Tax=Novosphingobium hassiacum TaxID=173676 RepID=A0A7W5ZYZ2_9SPHN|nr:MarR family transcriptional regulator [Novosphingobium hassiacum]MBB3861759.1 DNA-binding NarL/FixJ family response regulator [Novosphingobium hassiacum]